MDIDDELEMLQRELMAVQEEKTNPLSERTVAEIMVKLYHEGFAFIPTTDGNEYVTPEKLDQQIAALVSERGKIGLTILPQLLNVSQDVVEGRLNQVMLKWPVTRHGGNLFSQRYFDGMMVGLAQRLEEQGRIDLEQLAMQHELKMQFALKLVGENLPKLKAELSGKQLITKEYTFLQKAKILGFLSAINNPLQIDILLKTIEGQPKSTQQLVCELLQEGCLKGRLANGYYVPDRFTANQRRIVSQFLENNGYVDSEMLQRKYLISKPDEWIVKNLGSNFIKIEKYYIKEEKLESIAAQIHSQLKTEGFLELAHVLHLDFGDKFLNEFLEERCGLKDYFLCQGYCYSNQWLQRLAGEFKHKIIQSIFFKKAEPKGKQSKKKSKKQKVQPLVTEQELQEMLFNGGYADYSASETLATELLDLILQRLQELKKKIQKDLAQSKGLISSSFLKYKACKTILRTEESLNIMTNIIQKQLKKTQKWVDTDFGPNEGDLSGVYSILYYDNILPKGWPSMESLKWNEVKAGQLLAATKDHDSKPYPMKKCFLTPLCELIAFHNRLERFKIAQPEIQPLTEQSVVPFIYQFFISQREKRYVMVDNLLPFVDGVPFGSMGSYALMQKAYAKLRYCYKGIVNVGVHQLLLELTGKNSLRYNGDTQKQREEMFENVHKHLQKGDFIVVLAEGEADKRLVIQQKQTELFALQPYYIMGKPEQVLIHPVGMNLSLKEILQLFRNVFVITEQ